MALGPGAFERGDLHFWSDLQTRPYMRARFGLAQTLEDLDRPEEAVNHYRDLLRLNANDNQGVRELLLPLLLELDRDEEAGALLQEYAEDPSALWAYGRALWTFRGEGHGAEARRRLSDAVRANRYVLEYLTADRTMLNRPIDSYTFGSDEEAIVCSEHLGEAWRRTPGAVAWAKQASPGGPRGRKKSKRRRR